MPPTPMRFAPAVLLSSFEIFDALEACAMAERALLQSGRPAEAAGVAKLFELLEDRVTCPARTPTTEN